MIGMKVSGVGQVVARFDNISRRVHRANREQMKRSSERVVSLARRMCPRLTGDLEETIQALPARDADANRRLTISVVAGGLTPSGIDTSAYAIRVHEDYDEQHMGPETRLKQQGETLQIGRHFLTRALEMEGERLPDDIFRTVMRVIEE